jgi:hypothetical protein
MGRTIADHLAQTLAAAGVERIGFVAVRRVWKTNAIYLVLRIIRVNRIAAQRTVGFCASNSSALS